MTYRFNVYSCTNEDCPRTRVAWEETGEDHDEPGSRFCPECQYPVDPLLEATKAQSEILLWLAQRWPKREWQQIDDIRGGDLIPYYEEKWHARDRREGQPVVPFSAGTGKVHAWRRSGGLQLRRLREAGFLRFVSFAHGIPEYGFTKEGIRWIEAQLSG